MKRARGTKKTGAKTAVATVPQPHGGSLLAGGAPGNPGGSGRPPSALRERLRGSLEQRVQVLEQIADDVKAEAQDRIRAIDLLAKYGLGTLRELSVEDVRDRLRETVTVIRCALDPGLAAKVLAQLREIWTR